MKFYYVYILLCNDNSLYVGVTSNVDRRIIEHNEGKYPDAYTHSRRPVELVFYEKFTDPNQAIEFEKKIKRWSRVKKQALIDGDYDNLQNLSECRNATHHDYNPNKKQDLK
jgi:putative endonuclease